MYSRKAHPELDTNLTVVDVIQITLRVLGIIDDKCPTDTITVLSLIMTVIPKCTLINRQISCRDGFDAGTQYGLLRSAEFVGEIPRRHNRALIDEGSTVGIIGGLLEQTVPVLSKENAAVVKPQKVKETLTIEVTRSMVGSTSLLTTLIEKSAP